MRNQVNVWCAFVCAAVSGYGHCSATFADASEPGPYGAGFVEVAVDRTGGGTFTAVVYYPATGTGGGTPYDGAGAPYPAISFGHGFLQSVEQYQSTLVHLATHGYFVIASRSEGGLLPNHARFATDMRDCLTWLEQRNTDEQSAWFGQIDAEAFGLSGHSMGGGASILAASADPRVRALANLAAAETNPSAIAAMADVRVPTALIAGSQDTIVPVGSHGQLMYASGAAPKQLPIIVGGFHCGFTDNTFLFCDSGGISRAAQLAITRRLLVEFFDLYLKDADAPWRVVWGPEAFAYPAVMRGSSDSGLELLASDVAVSAAVGSTVGVMLEIRNTGSVASVFTLFFEGTGVTVMADPPVTPVLDVGESVEVTLNLTPQQVGAQSALISVRREVDGGTRGYVEIEVAGEASACAGDADGNGSVDLDDVTYVVLRLGTSPGVCGVGDVDGSGSVDIDDLTFVVLRLGTCDSDAGCTGPAD